MRIKEKGFTLVEVGFVIMILSVIFTFITWPIVWSRYTDKQENFVVKDVQTIIEAAQNYQYDYLMKNEVSPLDYTNPQIAASWPSNLEWLIDSRWFLSVCTKQRQQAGKCKRASLLYFSSDAMFTSMKSYTDGTHHYVLTIPTVDELSDSSRASLRKKLYAFGAQESDDGKSFDIKIPMKDSTVSHSHLVHRNGSKTLTGDWDLGGDYGITNAKDYLIAASDGSQISVSRRLVTIENVSHNQPIRKPTCSAGLSPNLILNVGEIGDVDGYDYLANFKAYIQNQNSMSWTVSIDTVARNVNTKKLEKTHIGKATALVRCI